MSIKFENKTVRSKITNDVPGLTEGKAYVALEGGFYQGPWVKIVNDRGEDITIQDADMYLHTEDLGN